MENLGEYRILGLLGEGGMGKVFEAEERLSGRRVALKVLRPELARSEPGRKLFENEMTILAQLDHPNVVRCLSCAEVEGELMMALELLPGRTLRAVLELDGALAWPRAVSLVQQIARALRAAHEHEPPIVHRDLKPENVMVLDDDTAKVTDFGIAKILAALAPATTHSVGTLAYMSPEQIDAGPVSAASDLYSLGLVFYELLAGRPPFASSSPRELLNLQCTAAPPPLPDEVRRGLPRGIERLLLSLLEKAPSRRPSSAALVLEALEPFAPLDAGESAATVRSSSPRISTSAAAASPRSAPADTPASTPRRAPASPKRETTTLPSTPAPTRSVSADTIALLERGKLPREVSTKRALLAILVLSALSGIATYAVRSGGAPAASTPVASRVSP